jgi:hypothetical protein
LNCQNPKGLDSECPHILRRVILGEPDQFLYRFRPSNSSQGIRGDEANGRIRIFSELSQRCHYIFPTDLTEGEGYLPTHSGRLIPEFSQHIG